MKPRSLASSQIGSRGQEVRHASMTSEYALDRGPIHSRRSRINASTGSANVVSLVATDWPLERLQGFLLLPKVNLRGGRASIHPPMDRSRPYFCRASYPSSDRPYLAPY